METGIRRLKLKDLQPTDTVRSETVEYLAALTTQEIEELKDNPEVWFFEETLLLLEGNNRSAVLASRGEKEMLVEYRGEPGQYAFLLAEDVENARKLIAKGITSPYELWAKRMIH